MGKFSLSKALNRLRFGGSDKKRQRFAIRNWCGISDINLLAAALSTETFRAEIRPRELSLDGVSSILVLAPHQDDELIGCGGLLLKARSAGIATTICFLTDGAQRNLRFGGRELTSDQVVAEREKEARTVCAGLKANYVALGISNLDMSVEKRHVEELARLISGTGATLVVLPWLFDGSPKHRIASQLLWHAIASDVCVGREVWGYQVNNTPFANGYMDISAEIDEKISLLEVYVSQNEGIRRYEHMARGLAAWNSRFLPSKQGDCSGRDAEIFFTAPADVFCDLVKTHYTSDFSATYLGKHNLAERMQSLAREFRRS